ncbi:MAG TPA: hypothetical protein VMJ10_32570 [Kofleriaceae bacterium]|nr:hypothetical protein [Kofleriaceae bacterium]
MPTLQTIAAMLRRLVVAGLVVAVACRGSESRQDPPQRIDPIPAPSTAGSGSAAGSGSGAGSDDYTPAEFKQGAARWKDTVVYLDGKPIAFLQFGELPIALKPTWVKQKVSQNKSADCPSCPAWKWMEERSYRFDDYLRALGVDIAKVKELHVQGPKIPNTIVATAADLLSPAAKEFMFRFGGRASGKALPHVPLNFGNHQAPDKISAVMIYIAKQPPKLSEDGYLVDGQLTEGVPYYGDPVRGGVRVYLDDRLAAIIKRQDLDPKLARKNPDGELAWNLYDFLHKNGVDTSKVVEGWVIRAERRHEKIAASELSTMWFAAPSKSGKSDQGAVLLGDQSIVTNVLALHSHALKPDELPQVRPDEED